MLSRYKVKFCAIFSSLAWESYRLRRIRQFKVKILITAWFIDPFNLKELGSIRTKPQHMIKISTLPQRAPKHCSVQNLFKDINWCIKYIH